MRAFGGQRLTEGRASKRGAILLECMLSLALLIMASVAVLACLDSAASAAGRRSDEARAAQIATSAMAMIDAGIMSPETVQGPVDKWRTGVVGERGWRVTVDTSPSEFGTLVHVTVRVHRGEDAALPPLASLHQLVELTSPDVGRAP